MWPWRQNSSYAKRDVQTRCKDTVTSQPVDQCELLHVDSELYDDRSTGGQVNALEANQLLDDRVVPSRITCSGHHNRAAKRVTSWHGTTNQPHAILPSHGHVVGLDERKDNFITRTCPGILHDAPEELFLGLTTVQGSRGRELCAPAALHHLRPRDREVGVAKTCTTNQPSEVSHSTDRSRRRKAVCHAPQPNGYLAGQRR